MALPELFATAETFTEPPPPRLETTWFVIAHLIDGHGWTVPSALRGSLYTDRQAAETAMANLPACWRWKRLVCIPGDKE